MRIKLSSRDGKLAVLLALLFQFVFAEALHVVHPTVGEESGGLGVYFTQVMELALRKSGSDYQLEESKLPLCYRTVSLCSKYSIGSCREQLALPDLD